MHKIRRGIVVILTGDVGGGLPRRCALTGRRGRRPLRSVTAYAVGRGALTPPHKGNGFPRQCEHWLGMTWAGRRGRRPLRVVQHTVP